MSMVTRSIGAPVDRIEGRDKVVGRATYAFDYALENAAYGAIVQSTIAKGTVRAVDAAAALHCPACSPCSRTRMHRRSPPQKESSQCCSRPRSPIEGRSSRPWAP